MSVIQTKPSERPPIIRYVIRNAQGFYYDGHGEMGDGGEQGVPHFFTQNILFAIKYGDLESIEAMIKTHKKWCIDRDQHALFGMFDTCDVLETYT